MIPIDGPGVEVRSVLPDQGWLTDDNTVISRALPRGIDSKLKLRTFHAHLYLGLYAEVTGDKKKALEHLKAAEDLPIGSQTDPGNILPREPA